MQSALARITTQTMGADELVALVLETGQYGVQVMALLDRANTTRYGHPELTKVNIGVGKNPGILISGHDLHDLEELLRQTEGTGVDVYTHSEMTPGALLSGFQEIQAFCRELWKCLVEAARRIYGIQRPDRIYYQLYRAATGKCDL